MGQTCNPPGSCRPQMGSMLAPWTLLSGMYWGCIIYCITYLNQFKNTYTAFGIIGRIDIGSAHDDVIKWKHFPRYWPFVRGIYRSPVNSPHKGQWRGALIFSLICVWINGWVNNGEAGDLRGYRAHYDVTVMYKASYSLRIVRKCQCYFSWYVDTHQPLSFIIWMTITPEIYVCLSCHHRESPQKANNANIVPLSIRHYLNVHDDVTK